MIRSLSRALLFTSLALALPAQEAKGAPPAAAAARSPLFVVRTASTEIAMTLAAACEAPGELPKLPANGHYVLTFGADRRLQLATGTGPVGLFDAVVDPGLLMDTFRAEIEEQRPMIAGFATLALQQGGITAKDAAGVVQGLFDFPRQLERVNLRASGDPEHPKEGGFDVVVDLVGRSGSGFAGLVQKLEPCPQGAPVLAGAGQLMTLGVSLAPASLRAVYGPLLELSVNLTNQGAEARKRAAALYDRWVELYDGGMVVSVDTKFRGQVLAGARDGEALRKVLGSPEFAEVQKEAKLADRSLELEVVLDALQHRGVKLGRNRIVGAPPSPLMPDGAMTSWNGAAGDYQVTAFGGDETGAKALVDTVLDGKVTRAPLAGGALLHVAFDVPALVAAMAEVVPGKVVAGDDMPARFSLAVGREQQTLRVSVHVQ